MSPLSSLSTGNARLPHPVAVQTGTFQTRVIWSPPLLAYSGLASPPWGSERGNGKGKEKNLMYIGIGTLILIILIVLLLA